MEEKKENNYDINAQIMNLNINIQQCIANSELPISVVSLIIESILNKVRVSEKEYLENILLNEEQNNKKE